MRSEIAFVLKRRHGVNLVSSYRVLGLKSCTYRYWYDKDFTPVDKLKKYEPIVLKIWEDSFRTYGKRRIRIALMDYGIYLDIKSVAKIMNALGIVGFQKSQAKYNSYRGTRGKVADNVIDRNFKADKPLEKLTTDVTEMKVNEEKLYLSPVLDMFNGEILTWICSKSPNLEMVTSMMNDLEEKWHPSGAIFHSDQGWQYQHREVVQMIQDQGMQQSMSRKGNCLDNSIMESFFAILKNELFYNFEWDSIDELRLAIDRYMDYYNNERIKNRTILPPTKYREALEIELQKA